VIAISILMIAGEPRAKSRFEVMKLIESRKVTTTVVLH